MMDAKLINLPYIAGLESLPRDHVKRDVYINQIEKSIKVNDILFITGDEGIGKTTLLSDFVFQNMTNSISFFINEFDKYTHSFDYILDKLYNQIFFYVNNEQTDIYPDLVLYNSIQGDLRKKIKQSRKDLYFVFDGFDKLNPNDLEKVFLLIDILPWKTAKFIFSGSDKNLSSLYSPKLTHTTIGIYNFGFHETKEYFSELTTSETELQEIHKLSNKGLPSKLKELKLLCINNGGVTKFLESENLSEKTNYLEKFWELVESKDYILKKILALIVFSDTDLEPRVISDLLEIELSKLEDYCKEIFFLNIDENRISFEINTLREFSKKKLIGFEDEVNLMLISYYESKQDSDESVFNLPHLYNKAKSWEKLTKLFTTDAFINFLDKYQTIVNINSQFSLAYNASKNTKLKFDEARLRFALHKSSVMQLEKHELWESEIQARILLEDYEQSYKLANSALLKEDRLKLLAILAKEIKINNLREDFELNDQIISLYEQIDFTKIREKGFEIASLLIYSNLQLAIELVEKVTDNSSTNNSLDYAFAYLTLYASQINKKSKSQIADIDILSSKIQDSDVKNLTSALRFLSDEYSFDDLFSNVKQISKFSQKLFILKNWIKNNKKNPEVVKAIKLTLEEIVRTSSENVPNATSLFEISIPLPYIEDNETVKELTLLFDAHKNTINRPTKSFVQLQLKIAEAIIKIDYQSAKDRIYDVYLLIEDLNDLSIKTDCLCFLWLWLSKNDKENEIENSLSTTESIEIQTKNNIASLLNGTAYHFKMVENIIETIIISNPDFVYEIVKKLNTQERRDFAFMIALENYVQKNKIEDLDFTLINKFSKEIKDIHLKENVVITIIDKFYFAKEKSIPHINKILPYYPFILTINQIASKCYIICHAIKILNLDFELQQSKINNLLEELKNSWDAIDVLWEKIEIGFMIARDLTDFSQDKAKYYLNASTELKHKEAFSSSSIANTYIESLKLSIIAFCGLVQINDKRDQEINSIFDTINVLQSTGEKLKLWSSLFLRLNSNHKYDLSKTIYKQFITPLLKEWTFNSADNYKSATIINISPSLYTFNSETFYSDYYCKLNPKEKDDSIKIICDYILSKKIPEDIINNDFKILKLDYTEINELCSLVGKLCNDFLIQTFLEKIVDCIKESKSNLSNEHLNSLKSKVKEIIMNNLPSKDGIQHEGYKIVAEADLLSLEVYDEREWKKLISRANLIPNISDRALILVVISNKMNVKTKSKKIELMENAFSLIKVIPSVYDKTNRFDATWESLIEIDRSKFKYFIKLALQDLLMAKDGEINGITNIIDVAQQHDSQLTSELITMLDNDPARKKLKEPFKKRIENKLKIDSACKNTIKLNELNNGQFQEVFRKNLTDLNNGKRTSKDITDTFEILDKSSNIPLMESLESYKFFIQNAIKKVESNLRDKDILTSIFTATIENTKLIGILSSDNIIKMKNLYKSSTSSDENPLISPGEKEKALEYIKRWLYENISDELIIIDPYFTEKELYVLKLVLETNPKCEVKILTSKFITKNNYISEETGKSINSEIYSNEWKNISSEEPPVTKIKIVWDKNNFTSPIHDRWIIIPNDRKGLKVGTSNNGFGSKESSIEKLNSESIKSAEQIIDKYLYRELTNVENYQLKYESFELEI